jgi:very-short-patch-repair endonuclease
MNKLILLIIVIGVITFIITLIKSKTGGANKEKEKPKYQYKKKDFFLTRAEHECFDALIKAVSNEYYIFAQVHLPTLIDNKIVGQNWKSAFSHISQKSVDFVLCDKAYLSPKLAIELDDKSHERPDRQTRDIEVERILQNAGVPLLRLENHGSFNPVELAQKIKDLVLK